MSYRVATIYHPSSAYWLYKTLKKCGFRVVGFRVNEELRVDVDAVILFFNPMYYYTNKKAWDWLSTALSRAKKKVAIVVTEGPVSEEAVKLLEHFNVAVALSKFVQTELAKVRVHLPLVRPGVEVNKVEKIFYVSFVASHVGPARIRKGVDIVEKIVKYANLPVVSNTPAGRVVVSVSIDVDKVVKMSKFLLFPSRSEGFGIPPLEAMAAGTVPICSDAPAHNEHCLVKVPTKYYGTVTLPEHPYPFYWYESCWRDYVEAIIKIRDRWEEYSEKALSIAEKYSLEDFCNVLEVLTYGRGFY